MIILQASLKESTVFLWAETKPTKRKRKADDQGHPFILPPADLAKALPLDADLKNRKGKHIAWLPSCGKSPLPSAPVLGDVAPVRGSVALAPWEVEGLTVTLPDLHKLRRLFSGWPEPPAQGVFAAPSLMYLLHVVEFSTSMAVRQQLLPGLRICGNGFVPAWKAVYLGKDRDRFNQLERAMPGVVRCLSDGSESEPTVASGSMLRRFVDDVIDASIRPDRSSTRPPAAKAHPHRHWIAGLEAPQPWDEPGRTDFRPLNKSIDDWTRPLRTHAEATHHLCFQLVEPRDEEGSWELRPLLQDMSDLSHYLTMAEAWKQPGLKPHLLAELGNATAVYPAIATSMKGKKPGSLLMDGNQALEFLTHWAAILEQADFRVVLPSWWTRTGTKKHLVARGKARTSSANVKGIINLDTIVDFSWEIAIGDHTLTRKELEELAGSKSPLVRLRGQWVHVSVDQIQAALDFWKKSGGQSELTLADVMRLSIGMTDPPFGGEIPVSDIMGTGKVGSLLKSFSDSSKLKEIPPPGNFTATLRPYQTRGYTWLKFLQGLGLGACLADDMGLGKTVQALAMIQRDREEGGKGPLLLVCPTSVLGNWHREAARFTPDLRVVIHHGPHRTKTPKKLVKLLKDHDMVVTSYTLLQKDHELFQGVSWRGVILDEAQFIKNHQTRQARAARSLDAKWRVALSGTPVENNVGELWSIMEFLNPGMLGTRAAFERDFIKPIQRESNDYTTEKLRRATGPFILRRLKSDKSIISDLPDKIENPVYCQLTREQGSLYAAALKDAEESLSGVEEGIKRRGVILGLLSRLKQICNHPAQFLGDRSTIEGRSGKLVRLGEMIEEVIHAGEHALVFTQFTEMGDIIKPHIEERFGREVLYLKGSVDKKRRDEMVRRFQEEKDAPPVFLLSLKAGGTGLNLTRASHVFHYDRWWNPAVENQATDRAYRIGQSKNVQVHKFVCIGTLEERIDELIRSKQELADKIVGSGEGWITRMSNTEIKTLIALGRDAVVED